jgi:hypothetical protein
MGHLQVAPVRRHLDHEAFALILVVGQDRLIGQRAEVVIPEAEDPQRPALGRNVRGTDRIGVVFSNAFFIGLAGSGLNRAVICSSASSADDINAAPTDRIKVLRGFHRESSRHGTQPAVWVLEVFSARVSGVHRRSPIINTSCSLAVVAGSRRNWHSSWFW